jgi:hypothetical protein
MKKLVVGLIAVAAVMALMAAGYAARTTRRVGTRTAHKPLVLLAGDSLTANYQDDAASLLTARGYNVITQGIPGSGLLDANQCDGSYARQLRRTYKADIVVWLANGNYGFSGLRLCQPMQTYGSTAFLKAWARSAKKTETIMSVRSKFYWVLSPQTGYSYVWEPLLRQIASIYVGLAATRPRGHVIDAYSAFGPFDKSLHTDWIHLNDAGSAKMAALVVREITH